MFPVTHAVAAIHLPIHRLYKILLRMPVVPDVKTHRDTTSRTCGDLKFNFDRITAWPFVWNRSYAVRMYYRCWSICRVQSFDMKFFDEATKWLSLLPQGVTLPPTFDTMTCKMHSLSIIYTIPFKTTCIGFSSALPVQFIIT